MIERSKTSLVRPSIALKILLLIGLFFAPPARASADRSAIIRPDVNWGTWEGWGVSLCWWAKVFGARDELADLLFTTNNVTLNAETLPGLGMNIVRYNLGGCSAEAIDGARMRVSPKIPEFKQIQGYWRNWYSADPASASWDWGADAVQREMLLKAKARGANLFEMFSDTPMWWMCINHNPSGADDGSKDNLQPWNYRQHAVYVATVTKHARDEWGIVFDSVEPFNEPVASWWKSKGKQEGCHFDPATQAVVIGYLRSELDARGLEKTVVAASDESFFDHATSTWNSFNATIRRKVGRVNVHGYQGEGGRRDLLYKAVDGKKLWNTEYGDGDASGLYMAKNLMLDFRWMHPTGWCYWQALDSHKWGLINAEPGKGTIGPSNPKYYVLAQFSRHIRPGMTIVESGDENTVAAYDAGNRRLVIVTLNPGPAETIRYNLAKFRQAKGPVQRWLTVPASGERYAELSDITIRDGAFSASFPAKSVQTFQVRNVVLAPE